jgi:two-component system heavy metal sensor histidine kinase CusS
MSLKSANKGSITLRLTIFYSLATFFLLAFVALFLYWGMSENLYQSDYQYVRDQIHALKNILQNKPHDFSALRQEVDEIPTVISETGYRYFIRVLDETGKLVIQTNGMQENFNEANFFNGKMKPAKKTFDWWIAPDGKEYLLMKARVYWGRSQKLWNTQVALDVSYQKSMIQLYRRYLIIMLLSGTLFSFVLGYWIARRGLKSLRNLTDAAEKITVSSLHQRIDPGSWPKELRTLGLAFNNMLYRIEASFSRLTQFSSDLAHELRTPVNNLMGETEVALSRQLASCDYRQVLESNMEELQRITQMIENLIFIARAENPQRDIPRDFLRVEKEVAIVCEYYQAMADEKKIEIICEGKAQLQANVTMFRRLISNLLSNALKYTENGCVHFKIKEIDKEVSIEIRDNGVGIAEEHLPKIFDRFYRVDAARTQHLGGVGLGLAIVKSIVELHHGVVSIASVLGQGTRVSLRFPR